MNRHLHIVKIKILLFNKKKRILEKIKFLPQKTWQSRMSSAGVKTDIQKWREHDTQRQTLGPDFMLPQLKLTRVDGCHWPAGWQGWIQPPLSLFGEMAHPVWVICEVEEKIWGVFWSLWRSDAVFFAD